MQKTPKAKKILLKKILLEGLIIKQLILFVLIKILLIIILNWCIKQWFCLWTWLTASIYFPISLYGNEKFVNNQWIQTVYLIIENENDLFIFEDFFCWKFFDILVLSRLFFLLLLMPGLLRNTQKIIELHLTV